MNKSSLSQFSSADIALLAKFDARYCIIPFGSKTRIVSLVPSLAYPGALVPKFYSPSERASFYSNASITRVGEDGRAKTMPLFKYWMSQKSAPRAAGVTLNPASGRFEGDRLNLWGGFGKTPRAGDWPLLRRHIETEICNGQKPLYDYFFKWLAFALQHPDLPAEVVVVLRGGTDNDLLAEMLRSIFAAHGLSIYHSWELTRRYRKQLLYCCFIFLDETMWPKIRADVLRRFATEPTRIIKPKGFEIGEAANRASMMMSVKEGWEPPADDHGHLAVLDGSDRRNRDWPYFDALYKEIITGGAEAFLADVLAMDLPGGWHPRNDVPRGRR